MIKIFDCTLRDGGWVNHFHFGKETMCRILKDMSQSGVEYVELGYLDEKNGESRGYSMYPDMDSLQEEFSSVPKNSLNIKKMIMIDYGKFMVENLPDRENSFLDGIRLCFHKKNLKEAVSFGKEILNKGYLLAMQPMVVTRYSETEFIEMIQYIQSQLKGLHALYIVDSFGCMDKKELCIKLQVMNQNLNQEISIGIHLHNNRNLAFENAAAVYEWSMGVYRDLIVDATLMGIGKGSGNLSLENYAEYLNLACEKQYDIASLKKLASETMQPFRDEFSWGYAPIYELSAKYHVTPSYAKIICEENGLSFKQLEEFLKRIPEDKKDSCDRVYVAQYMKHLKSGEKI